MAQEQDKERAQPVAWSYVPSKVFGDVVLTADPVRAEDARTAGFVVTPLYAAPQPNAALADGCTSDDEPTSAFTPAHAEWEGRQVFHPAMVGSWPWLRGCINGIPKREEFIGGQRTRYVALDAVLGWLDEGERRAAFVAAPPTLNASKEGSHG